MEDEEYDAIVVFDNPITIRVDECEKRQIYGLLYFKSEAHKEDLWIWNLNRYISYLSACEKIQNSKGELKPETVITPQGRIITLSSEIKNLIYRVMRDRMTSYRLVEFNSSLVVYSDEFEDRFIVSQDLLSRYGIEVNRIKTVEVYDEDVE